MRGVYGALVGGALVLLGIHAINDHQALHEAQAVTAFVTAHAKQIAALPAGN